MTVTKPENATASNTPQVPRERMLLGAAIFIFGFICPLFIPFVYMLDISLIWKTSLAGFLALGIPELFMLIAVAVLGKPGFDYLKQKLASVFKPLAPPDEVSRGRYRFGLVLFIIPLLLAWLLPYVDDLIPWLDAYWFWINLGGDLTLIVSLFVLGGDFWDKLRGLFYQKAKIHFYAQ